MKFLDRESLRHLLQLNNGEIGLIKSQIAGIGDTLDYLLSAVGSPLSHRLLEEMPLGSIIHLPIDGIFRPYMVMRRGAPNANYHGWGNAVFLIQMMAFEMRVQSTPIYEDSPVDTWLENDFYGSMIPDWLRPSIVQGHIPYATGFAPGTVRQGAQGLSRHAFVPSITELGAPVATNTFVIGTDFGAFPTQAERILRNSAQSGVLQHTRTHNTSGNHIVGVAAAGSIGPAHALTANMAIRPIIGVMGSVHVNSNNILVA